MTRLETYKATDRRIYNGAACDDLRHEWNHTAKLEKRMKKAEPTAHCAFFPGEDKFMVFIGYSKILTGNFHDSKQEALIEAINILEKPNV